MFAFILKRLGLSLLILLILSFLTYSLIGLMPGDPIDIMLAGNPHMTPEDAARLRALQGLDQPIYIRYWNWLTAALQGDFGYSRQFNLPVLEVLLPRLGNTAILISTALVIAISIAIPTGVFSARHQHTWVDSSINFFCFAGISMPPFWLALLLILLFSVTLGWLPASGVHTIGNDTLLDRMTHLVMPVMTLSLLYIAAYTRHTRAAMVEQLRQDYLRTARAKGVSDATVTWKHALRNALIPVVTLLALDIGTLFGGALITEQMFTYSGMGKLLYDSIMHNDFNVALVGLMLVTAMVLFGNFLADIGYAALDPRVTYQGKET